MNKNQIIAILVTALLITSLFFLAHLLFQERAYLEPTTPTRLTVFSLLHVFMCFHMIWFSVLLETYDYVRWGFVLSFVNAFAITCAEVAIFISRSRRGIYQPTFAEPLEMAYLNFYFLIYMYSLIASFLCGLFFCLTKCFAALHERRIQEAVHRSIRPLEFSEALGELDCPICLAAFQEGQKLLQINCKHLFHEDCLMEWIRVNQTCPNCRFSIFEPLEREEMGAALAQQ